MNPLNKFKDEKNKNISIMGLSKKLKKLALDFIVESSRYRYSYNFSWLGRPIIQYPQDIVMLQEIIWEIRPDLIIETGIAHGGSLIFYASMLELLGGNRKVLGIDIDIRKHNRKEIEKHALVKRIEMIEGSSVAPKVINQVEKMAKGKKSILIALDSLHTHRHVLAELRIYSKFVTKGSYLIIFDTIIDRMPKDFFPDRPWGKKNNPWTAVKSFLTENPNFQIDNRIESKLLITVAPNGYLRKVR